jgi:hypothetical protein
MSKLGCENVQALSQNVWEMLVKLKILDDIRVCSKDLLVMMLDGDTNDFLGTHLDVVDFHVLFILENVVRWLDQATLQASQRIGHGREPDQELT